jgi:hypothetical protein
VTPPPEHRILRVLRRLRSKVRRTTTVVALGLGLIIVRSSGACVIADPPSDLPRLPEGRPTILRASVVPTASAVVGRWPDRFIVPVELSDPRATIFYSSFVDYNPDTGFGLIDTTRSDFEASITKGRVRQLEVGIPTPAALDRCHVVEVVVALRQPEGDQRSAHTPGEPGGDIVTWFFSPSGFLEGCPVLDAGLPPPPPPDAGDGGLQ